MSHYARGDMWQVRGNHSQSNQRKRLSAYRLSAACALLWTLNRRTGVFGSTSCSCCCRFWQSMASRLNPKPHVSFASDRRSRSGR
jgi:hypothetical protein